MAAQALATLATVLAVAPHGNTVEVRLDHGSAEIAWVSDGAFRFRRSLDGALGAFTPAGEDLGIRVEEQAGAFLIRSRKIEVSISKRGALITVRQAGDDLLMMRDLWEPAAVPGGGIAWEREMPRDAHYYGLAQRTDLDYDWRGRACDAVEIPFLISTEGYGEYHAGGGRYRFDFAGKDRYRVEAPRVDYYFLYGPRPKGVFEELSTTKAAGERAFPASTPGPGWQGLRDEVVRITHGLLAGMLDPGARLGAYANADPALRERARQVLSLLPDATEGPPEPSAFRQQLATFYLTYATETRDKGYPVWHPLPFQFPEDPECARHADEFMLGDEMLIAPILDASGKRTIYLPQGIWTNLETNEELRGRQTITVQTKSLPVFARNGTIVPLDSRGGMGLHYFPTLAAEFFLLNMDVADWTQVHASPAADIFRLEIDSKTMRDYQWVVHHVEKPAGVGFEDVRYQQAAALGELKSQTWFYDATAKNLHIRVRVNAGDVNVIHVTW